ncbi:gliding motility-associated C-terminal domain-containing protein [Flavihumibacter petaseus]|nr:gliding motility-associated C-terminal domain-containing protein [Flavihumibacter petaseus]
MLLINAHNVLAQDLSNKGKEFWVGYGHHQYMEPGHSGSAPVNSQEMVLYFSAEDQPATVRVTIRGTAYEEIYQVPANTVISSKPIPKGGNGNIDARLFTLPGGAGTSSEQLFSNNGIHIESNTPVVAYAHIYGQESSGAAMLLPVETWGHAYVSLTTRQYYNSNRDCFSWICIIASEDGTRVRIVPTVNTRRGRKKNIPFEIELQQGEVYQLLGESINSYESAELTGTSVTAIEGADGKCHPIAVFTGSSRTGISCADEDGSGDNLIQQMMPFKAWGKRYLTAPTSVLTAPQQANMNVYRIAVRDPNTIVKKNGQQLYGINGFYYEYQSNTADIIEADQPVMVAQFLPSSNSCGYIGEGDPELIYLSPLEQAVTRTGFYRNDLQKIDANFVTLIIPDSGLATLLIDGAANAWNHRYTHPQLSGYSVVVKRWKSARAQCIVSSRAPFTAITYGLGVAESYGYNAGTKLNSLNGLPWYRNSFAPDNQPGSYTCVNSPLEFSILLRFQPVKLTWHLSELNGNLDQPADQVQLNPVASGTQTINGISYFQYTLPGTFRFMAAGLQQFHVTATGTGVENCDRTETLAYPVDVRPALSIAYTTEFEHCVQKAPVAFDAATTAGDGSTITGWKWTTLNHDGSFHSGASGRTWQQEFTAGKYSVQLQANDANGCVADTTTLFELAAKPETPYFNLVNPVACANRKLLLIENSPNAGVQRWYWDLGNGDTVSLFSEGQQYAASSKLPDTLIIKHVTAYSNTCVSDTAVAKIVVYANPVTSTTVPVTCFRTNDPIPFETKVSFEDDQQLKEVSWTFGDGSSAHTLSGHHSWPAPGSYPVSLTVTGESGCVSTVDYHQAVHQEPTISFPLMEPVCSAAGIIPIANASITNGVAGRGWYGGDGVTANGSFDPAKAGPGSHEILFVYESGEACRDTARNSITVFPSPTLTMPAPVYAIAGTVIILEPKVNSLPDLQYSWTPPTGLSSALVLKPQLTVDRDQEYRFEVKTPHCSVTGMTAVHVLKAVKVPNVFSPNGDNIHDRWEIENLAGYPGCLVEVYNRYGQMIWRKTGYETPWDGRVNGNPVPVGTYYYIIDRKNGYSRLSGSVTIIK